MKNSYPNPSPKPRRLQNAFRSFNPAAAPVNTVGTLLVVLGVLGIVVDGPATALLTTGGEIEVCSDVGLLVGGEES